LQEQKAAIREKLQQFQDEFLSKNGRKIRFHRDILPIEKEYKAYKTLKDDIAKAEAEVARLT